MVRFIFLFVLVLILSPLVASAADPQTGGLPDVAARVAILETIVTTLQTNIITLQTNVTALQAANSGLQNALNTEIGARMAADTALQSALNNESGQRSLADSLLNALLSKERTDRSAADQHLESLIAASEAKTFQTYVNATFLPNGNQTTVATLGPLPPGNYFVTARMVVFNVEHDAMWTCSLVLNDTVVLDYVNADTESVGPVNGLPRSTIVMQRVAAVTAPGVVTIRCASGVPSSDVDQIWLIAIQVGRPG